MSLNETQISDLRDAFARVEAHITELENRLIAVLDTLELGDDAVPKLTPWGEAELALELDHEQEPPF